ncbi:HNH endonuclease [Tenacibaculum phage Gundel_1]|uniref:HNH endonuclease n=1 Tax=Tenacibaculum phage Gundel_1 TaxID=2745672 RepID=A0A8E5EA32_9CAUD|nr:HNH endonuclease [Tenacibaculum phage Gundel_1]QQV91433.1 HNH endonuclease [Tenacibaculum phage Gundel_1]
MKQDILRLRKEGKTYTEIQNSLGCSRGTISYHCGKGQKEKTKARTIKNRRNTKSKILRKIDLFINRNSDNKLSYRKRSEIHVKMLNKVLDNPICYLTGKEINLHESESYNLDHIIPFSKGGENTLSNMGLTSKDANHSKSYLTFNEYINLCKDVLNNNGYKVSKRVMD